MTEGYVFAEEYTLPSMGKVYDVKVNPHLLIEDNTLIKNEYYDMYIKLIENNLSRKREKYMTQCHHIIPKCYFVDKHIPIDDSNANKIILVHKDHVIAHYYLALCSNNERFRCANINAIRYALNMKTFKLSDDYEEQKEFLLNLSQYDSLQIERNNYMSKLLQGRERDETYRDNIRKAHIGRVWIYKDDELKQVLPDELDFYLDKGWSKGNPRTSIYMREKIPWNKGIPMSERTKSLQRISKEGRIHVNNGKISKMIFPSEFDKYSNEGFVRGRLCYSRER